ncbi:MAG: hypothetical protein CBD21_01130 [bacterium TMED161]|nr:hypothetical protein [Candidatus Neomarinimicrobiota bacterium]OUW21532.1 MAG: hypothetical protein CBD21_01130 [bacterium TMED161]|tara:strand:+ start:15505 stop:16503 length:999 start_codon:yes stop_codon:yes gene_type:complete
MMIKEFFKSNPIHKKIVPSLDVIMIARLSSFFGVWAMVCIGMYIGDLINNTVDINSTTLSIPTSILFLGISFICASIFIANQIHDLEVDKINNKAKIIDNFITIEFSKKILFFLLFIGFLLIIFIDLLVAIPMISLYVICGMLFTNQNFNFKQNMFMNFLFYIFLALFLILSGLIYSRNDMAIITLITLSLKFIFLFLLIYGAIVLAINILDREGDRQRNRITIPQNIGIIFTSIIAFLMCLFSFFIGLYLKEPLSVVCSISSIPFFSYLIFRGKEIDVIRSIRYPILLINFYLFMIYPLLFYPIVITYYISKYYYWHRFSLHYPTLLVDND